MLTKQARVSDFGNVMLPIEINVRPEPEAGGGGDDGEGDPPLPPDPVSNDDNGDTSGGISGTSSSGGPPPPCTDADGCGCEDLKCKLAKAVEKAKQNLVNDLTSYRNSIMQGDGELDDTGVSVNKFNNRAAKTTVDNLSEVVLPYILEKNWNLMLKFRAKGETQKVDNKIKWVPKSFNSEIVDDLGCIGTHHVWAVTPKSFKIIQSNSTDDTKMNITTYGILRIQPMSATFEVSIPGLTTTVNYQPYQDKDFQKSFPQLDASKYYKD
jgi:hypothetical protein